MLIANLIDLYLAACPEIRGSQLGALKRMRGESIGKSSAPKLTPQQVIAFAQERFKTVQPSTIAADIGYLKGALDYAEVGLGIEGVSSAAIHKAMPILKQQRLVGSSGTRERMPTAEETQRIIVHVGPGLKADVIAYQDKSGRRISESCRHEWQHLDVEHKTILVCDGKHPKMRTGYTRRYALPDDAFAILIRQPRLTNAPDELIFKVSKKVIGDAYRKAVRALKIEGLQLRDSRRGTNTRLLKEFGIVKAKLVIGHISDRMTLGTYNGNKAEDFHA